MSTGYTPITGSGNTILDKIVVQKHKEVLEARQNTPIIRLEESEYFHRECYSIRQFILDPERTGIIAEFKRASPSKGVINSEVFVSDVTQDYANAGASALSILTDQKFFGGHMEDVLQARPLNQIPILRKEFILDEYQILEAKSIGADIILLIAAILSPEQVAQFAKLAKSIGLNVLLEVHNAAELEHTICDDLDAIGVNNRNLADFSVSLQHSYDLVNLIPDQFLKISESGISNPATIKDLKKAGFNGFLIGENFMREKDPGAAIQQFVAQLK
ncbi:indole-3-glycerol phosphate synthase TrpC [Pedobacter sp. SYSU D00535]|uniref:indole-3-glycerol phosphate synthase TrpC n=1 Tax=Pedobacter sp. SYSU D00535 TaxID=2810308 RepID=UPI001A96E6DE|nr:indole-3-glycerol phosphate synthase TrpC [Pedobacter sp. SYSU D00535]